MNYCSIRFIRSARAGLVLSLALASIAGVQAQVPSLVPVARCVEYLNTAVGITDGSTLFNISYAYYDSVAGIKKVPKGYPGNYLTPGNLVYPTHPAIFYTGYHRDSFVVSEPYFASSSVNWVAIEWIINSLNTRAVPLGDTADSGVTASPTCATELALNNFT